MEDACTSQTVEEDYEDDNKSEQVQPKKRRKRNREKKINVDGLRDFVPKQISSKNSFWHFSKVNLMKKNIELLVFCRMLL